MTELEIAGISIATIGTVAACIAALPIIKEWFPISLSQLEKDILCAALENPKYPGIVQYWIIPLGDRDGPHVSAPYSTNHIAVVSEILSLREKGFIEAMDRMTGQHQNAIWYQLTSFGFSRAKKLNDKQV